MKWNLEWVKKHLKGDYMGEALEGKNKIFIGGYGKGGKIL